MAWQEARLRRPNWVLQHYRLGQFRESAACSTSLANI